MRLPFKEYEPGGGTKSAFGLLSELACIGLAFFYPGAPDLTDVSLGRLALITLGVLGSAAAVLVISGLAYELLQWKRPPQVLVAAGRSAP